MYIWKILLKNGIMRNIIFAATAFILCMTAAAAQEQTSKSYIYCEVDLVHIGGGRYEIVVDYGQHDNKLFPKTLNDKCLIPAFNSEMAVINWMSRNGWELFLFNPHINDGSGNDKYIMRMDVTGLTEEEINQRLVLFQAPVSNAKPPQLADGSFITVNN